MIKVPDKYKNVIVVKENITEAFTLCEKLTSFLKQAITEMPLDTPEQVFTVREYMDYVISAQKIPTEKEAQKLEKQKDYIELENEATCFNNELILFLMSISPAKDYEFTMLKVEDIDYMGYFDSEFIKQIEEGDIK